MSKKSKVSCFSVLKADPATRSGMIEVLQSLASHCPAVVQPEWHPPLAPTYGRVQSTMVSGDYGYWEMGNVVYDFYDCLWFDSKQIGQKVLFNRSGERDNIARMAGLVPVLQQWHKKKV